METEQSEAAPAHILIQGRAALPDEITKGPADKGKLLEKHGWEYRTGYCQYRTLPQVYGEKAKKAGETYGGGTFDGLWIDAIHRDRKLKLHISWKDNAFEDALYGLLFPVLINSNVLNAIIRGDIESPTEYKEWYAAKKAAEAEAKRIKEENKNAHSG